MNNSKIYLYNNEHIVKKKRHILILMTSFACILFIIGYIFYDAKLMFGSVLFLYAISLFYSWNNINSSLIYFGFLCTFFVFLLGKYTVEIFFSKNYESLFNKEIDRTIFTCLFLSLLFILIGFVCSRNKSSWILKNGNFIEYQRIYKSVFRVALILFYFTYSFKLLLTIEKVLYVSSNLYIALYTSFRSLFPWFVHKIAESHSFIFFVILATMPSRKQLKIPVMFFLVNSILNLLTGVRGAFAYDVVFILLYYGYRQSIATKLNNYEIWISTKMKIIMLLFAPISLIFLSLYASIRVGLDVKYSGFFQELIGFFVQQGGSANVIGYTALYINNLPDTNTSYLFGPIINLYKYGWISRFLAGDIAPHGNSIENALTGNNLGATITYLVNPTYFLNGGGLGTQYIAEAYADFKYVGVIFFSLFLGNILKNINFIIYRKWYINAIIISIISMVLQMPRSFAFSFFASIISVRNWLIVLFITVIANSIRNKNGKSI